MTLSTQGYRIAGVGKVSRNLFSLKDFISYLYILIPPSVYLSWYSLAFCILICYSSCKAEDNNQEEFVLVMLSSLDLLTITGLHYKRNT